MDSGGRPQAPCGRKPVLTPPFQTVLGNSSLVKAERSYFRNNSFLLKIRLFKFDSLCEREFFTVVNGTTKQKQNNELNAM